MVAEAFNVELIVPMALTISFGLSVLHRSPPLASSDPSWGLLTAQPDKQPQAALLDQA